MRCIAYPQYLEKIMNDTVDIDGTGSESHKALPPETLAARALRRSMYQNSGAAESAAAMAVIGGDQFSGALPDDDDDDDPSEVISRPVVGQNPPAANFLSPKAAGWARKNPKEASSLLEWASTTHEPKNLNIRLLQATFSVVYVKLETVGDCHTFYLAASAPAVGIEFGVVVNLEFEGRSTPALTALTGAGSGQFPYARLEFFEAPPKVAT